MFLLFVILSMTTLYSSLLNNNIIVRKRIFISLSFDSISSFIILLCIFSKCNSAIFLFNSSIMFLSDFACVFSSSIIPLSASACVFNVSMVFLLIFNCSFCSFIVSCISSTMYLTVFRSSIFNSSENIPIASSTFRHILYTCSYMALNSG